MIGLFAVLEENFCIKYPKMGIAPFLWETVLQLFNLIGMLPI
jgi:hypothetical protein